MKGGINHLRLVTSNEFPVQKEKKTRWWHKWHILQLYQIPLGIVVAACVVVAVYFQRTDDWHHAALAWMGAFLFMFLFWFFGYQAQKDFEWIKLLEEEK